jgi:acetyl esterase/lipase
VALSGRAIAGRAVTALPPEAALTIRDLEVRGALFPLAARCYSAAQAGRKRDGLLVFFHGGGFVGGDLDEADALSRQLALRCPGHLVLAVNYTLASTAPFPAAAEDAHAILLWAKRNKGQLGWSGKRLVVVGVDAGANLAAVCALMARDRAGPALAGQILIMPMLDPGQSCASMRDLPRCADEAEVASACAAAYRGYLPNAADRSHPYASPLQSSRLKNLPPALILSCAGDPLRDEAEQYGARLAGSGVNTTVTRLPATPLQPAGARNECAGQDDALDAIAAFMAAPPL